MRRILGASLASRTMQGRSFSWRPSGNVHAAVFTCNARLSASGINPRTWSSHLKILVDSIDGNCLVAGAQNHARRPAASIHFERVHIIRHGGKKLRGAFGV